MELSEQKKKLVSLFMEHDVLLSPNFVEHLSLATNEYIEKIVEKLTYQNGPLVMNKEIENFFSSIAKKETNWEKFESMLANFEKKKIENNFKKVFTTVKEENERIVEEQRKKEVEVTFSYQESDEKKNFQSFVSYFNKRYIALKNILQNRQELERASAISRVKVKIERETVAIIGMVKNKSITKNGNVIMTLEDPSGEMNVLINQSKQDVFEKTKSVVLDEVIGVVGMSSNGIIFVNKILFPDIPLNHEIKKSQKDESIAVLGDIHLGSKYFLYDEFNRMIKWLKGEFGSIEQREEAKKIKYLFLIGDLVDGVGIYPGQENDLEILDITKQFESLANYLKKIPEHINIIISAGNHDPVRIAEPQPKLPEDFAAALYELPNVTMVSNPAVVTIGGDENFPGFDVLLYHGFSFPFFGDSVEPLRTKGGLERVEVILEFLMKKRHLAPTHTSTQYIPDEREDFLVIKNIPDIFITGHIHRTSITNYRGVTMMNSSTWIGMTDFQEKVGLHPMPARVPIINLKTRKAKILKF